MTDAIQQDKTPVSSFTPGAAKGNEDRMKPELRFDSDSITILSSASPQNI